MMLLNKERSLRIRPGLVMLCLLVACFFFVSCSHSSPNERTTTHMVPVAATKVTHETLSQKLVLSAEFRPFQEVDLHAKVAGYIKNIYVDIGDHVKTGELLAVLEIPEMQDEIAQSEADIRHNEEEIAQARAALAEAKANYKINHLTYDRLAAAGNARPNLIAQQDIDNARAKNDEAKAQTETANASLAAAVQQLQSVKANKQRLETLYSYAAIIAPFTGVVTKRYADVGTMIQAGTTSQTQSSPVVRLSQNDLLRLTVPVPESAAPLIRVGTIVSVTVPSLHKTFQGKVARFADQLDFSTRTMPTEIDVPNPYYELVPGMYAETTFTVSHQQKSLTLPIEAIRRENNKTFVLLINEENKVEERAIKIGIEMPDKVEVLSGLKENDEVVLGNAGGIKLGEKVEPVIQERD